MSIPLNDTDLGYLALVIDADDYTTANGGVAFVSPTYSAATTSAQIMETNRIYAENTRNFKTF